MHQKRFGSVDEGKEVICGLEQMWLEDRI